MVMANTGSASNYSNLVEVISAKKLKKSVQKL